MSPAMEEVLRNLRQLYPDAKIHIWEKFDRGKLFVDDHRIVTFNLELLEKQLALHDETEINAVTKFLAEYIETKYWQRKNQFVRTKGNVAYNLTKAQVEYAIANTQSNAQAARFMNLNFTTWKKYAVKYGLYEGHIKPFGKGIPKLIHRAPTKLEDIFAGKHPNYNIYVLKRRIIKEMIMEEKCQRCGWREARKEDEIVPLFLDFIDNNPKNLAKDNLRLICYNCAFILHGKINLKRFMKRSMEKLIEKEYGRGTEISPAIPPTKEEEKYDDLFDEFNKKG